ncbi:MAG: putative metallopeptidase [Planctomycetaceae bacterium]
MRGPPGGTATFDFSSAMSRLCEDVTDRVDELLHVDMSQVAVSFAQTRRRVLHGLQAKLTPMRFEGGAVTTQRNGRLWTCQRLIHDGREMLYILTFYLPRFLDQPFVEKLTTITHELLHVSPHFDGDLRRFDGRCYMHSPRQKEFDRQAAELARKYLAGRPPVELSEFLRHDFRGLVRRHGAVVGLQVPIPKLIPLRDTRSA